MTRLESAAPPRKTWESPYGLRLDGGGAFRPCPARAVEVTLHAWNGLLHDGPDQFAPGLDGVATALAIRNLALSLPGRPPLVVYSTDSALTRGYHDIVIPVLGRWATKTPMHFRGEHGKPTPLDRRGVSRSNPPTPRVHRAFNGDELAFWAQRMPSARTLIIVESPDDIPSARPPNAHVILTGALYKDPRSQERIRLPARFVAPVVAQPVDQVLDAAPPLLQVVPVDAPASSLATVHGLYMELMREDWKRFAAFLGTCRTINQRIQADAFPPNVQAAPEDGAALDALIRLLDGFIRFGHAPAAATAREFISAAAATTTHLVHHATPKADWLQTHRGRFEAADAPDLVVDGRYNQARGRRYLQAIRVAGRTPKIHLPTRIPPVGKRILVTAAPNSHLLQTLVSADLAIVELLLYPWEMPVYAAGRRRLIEAVNRLGVTNWPLLPAPPPAPATAPWPGRTAQLVFRPRTTADEVDAEQGPADADDDLATDERNGPIVVITTTVARHEFPSERVVLVQRAGTFHELPAHAVRASDVLVAPRGGGHPSAHQVIARICARKPLLNRTRTMATYWRRLLRDHVNAHHKGQRITQIHEALNPSVTYGQFRHWYLENEPVCPTRENLDALFHVLGQPKQIADLVYRAGLDHKSDRRRIYAHLVNLATNRLDRIYADTAEDVVADPDNEVNLEDLQAVIQFEKITGVEPKQ